MRDSSGVGEAITLTTESFRARPRNVMMQAEDVARVGVSSFAAVDGCNMETNLGVFVRVRCLDSALVQKKELLFQYVIRRGVPQWCEGAHVGYI